MTTWNVSLSAAGQPLRFGGTSVAVAFVTGAIALLWSEFPAATAAQIKLAICQACAPRRASVVPPLLGAATAYQSLLAANTRLSASPRFSHANLRDLTSLFPVKRCCQYSPTTGRIECTSAVQRPGYECDCIRTSTFPSVICRPLVLAPGWA